MTARPAKRNVLKVSRTGWSKSRTLPGKPIRTCVAAVADSGSPPSAHIGADGNIVRGED
ncbi:hypothetical protein [Streptomyces sp. HD]|uniref:hypothetical protein n=1 Tax=Streptomyces sp. HD TaxID=3020892 RepID=UPI00232CFF3A|nr:hypothetical protein [Streptomyces sp. HD]MDC0769515.1 hypothetical protein [Streptomyces sp. HD]